MTLLAVQDLRAGYERIPVLQGITFEIKEGSFTGILGHNGMGKSTLMKTVAGQIRATGGSVSFRGRDVTREPVHKRTRMGLGYVPQGREIFPSLTVEENLRMGLLRVADAKGDGADRIERVLEEFPRLKPLLGRRGGVLSGGEQQILAIARSLCGDPTLLVLDEPTEGIQPSINEEIIEVLHTLRQSRRLTLLLVEQKLDFIAALAERTFVIQRGRITGALTPAELANPDVVREFIGIG